jgi:hypothetical protein
MIEGEDQDEIEDLATTLIEAIRQEIGADSSASTQEASS